jgi:hypothetical protein
MTIGARGYLSVPLSKGEGVVLEISGNDYRNAHVITEGALCDEERPSAICVIQ